MTYSQCNRSSRCNNLSVTFHKINEELGPVNRSLIRAVLTHLTSNRINNQPCLSDKNLSFDIYGSYLKRVWFRPLWVKYDALAAALCCCYLILYKTSSSNLSGSGRNKFFKLFTSSFIPYLSRSFIFGNIQSEPCGYNLFRIIPN